MLEVFVVVMWYGAELDEVGPIFDSEEECKEYVNEMNKKIDEIWPNGPCHYGYVNGQTIDRA